MAETRHFSRNAQKRWDTEAEHKRSETEPLGRAASLRNAERVVNSGGSVGVRSEMRGVENFRSSPKLLKNDLHDFGEALLPTRSRPAGLRDAVTAQPANHSIDRMRTGGHRNGNHPWHVPPIQFTWAT